MNRSDPNWPVPISNAVTSVMKSNRWRDTRPEARVRSLLHTRGLRFRKQQTIKLDGRRWTQPDVVFPKQRLAVYVDGCFWHACPLHATRPKNNADYWGPKLARNVARDRDTDRQLSERGWTVLRAWEHEPADEVAARVEKTLFHLRRDARA